MNTDIDSYTMDELFGLLDIPITKKSSVESIKEQILQKSDEYIKGFRTEKNMVMVEFFEKVKQKLVGKDPEKELSQPAEPEPKMVSKLLNIDSRFRQNYDKTTSTNFLIDLPYPINNVVEMKLCDLELPSTYYAIRSSLQNNYFWFSTYTDSQIETKQPEIYYVSIEDGNYSSDTLIAILNERIGQLDSTDVNFTPIPVKFQFDLDFNNSSGTGDGTGKVTIGLSSLTDIRRVDFNFHALPIPDKLAGHIRDVETQRLFYSESTIPFEQHFGWMLGFRKPVYEGAEEYVSESIMNILGPQYLFLVVEDFNKSNNVNFIGTSRYGLLPDSIMARISLKVPPFSIQSQNDFSVYSETRTYFGPVNINKIQVRLYDEYSRLLDLNASDFSFTLRLTTIYSTGKPLEKERVSEAFSTKKV
jgi:hypothetical protein